MLAFYIFYDTLCTEEGPSRAGIDILFGTCDVNYKIHKRSQFLAALGSLIPTAFIIAGKNIL